MSKNTKSQIDLSNEQKQMIKRKLQTYWLSEFEGELSGLEADLFLDFLNEEIGAYFFNQGVVEAMQTIKERADELVLLIKEN